MRMQLTKTTWIPLKTRATSGSAWGDHMDTYRQRRDLLLRVYMDGSDNFLKADAELRWAMGIAIEQNHTDAIMRGEQHDRQASNA